MRLHSERIWGLMTTSVVRPPLVCCAGHGALRLCALACGLVVPSSGWRRNGGESRSKRAQTQMVGASSFPAQAYGTGRYYLPRARARASERGRAHVGVVLANAKRQKITLQSRWPPSWFAFVFLCGDHQTRLDLAWVFFGSNCSCVICPRARRAIGATWFRWVGGRRSVQERGR